MKLQLIGAGKYSFGTGKEFKTFVKGEVYDLTAEQLKAIPKEDQALFKSPEADKSKANEPAKDK